MPRILVKALYIFILFLLIVPLFVIGWLLLCAWRETHFRAYTLTVGTGTLILAAFTTVIGFMSWKKSMWRFGWIAKICFILFVIEILVFLYAYDYLDEIFDYETHSIFFFVASLVPMTLFVYSLSARSAIDLEHVYKNFVLYYRQKLKERPIVQPEEVKFEDKRVHIEASKDEPKCGQECSQEDRRSEINLINMSMVLSKASMKSGEMSHSGDIPGAFPGIQDNPIPVIINEVPETTKDDQYEKDFKEIIYMTRNYSKTTETLKCAIYLLLSALIYATYNIEYQMQKKKRVFGRIGIIQTLYLIYFDLLIIFWSKSYLRNKVASITTTSVLMLACRVLLSVTLRYWVITHCIIYVILVSIVGNSLCAY